VFENKAAIFLYRFSLRARSQSLRRKLFWGILIRMKTVKQKFTFPAHRTGFNVAEIASPGEEAYEDTSRLPRTTYYFKLRAVRDNLKSGFSRKIISNRIKILTTLPYCRSGRTRNHRVKAVQWKSQ